MAEIVKKWEGKKKKKQKRKERGERIVVSLSIILVSAGEYEAGKPV